MKNQSSFRSMSKTYERKRILALHSKTAIPHAANLLQARPTRWRRAQTKHALALLPADFGEASANANGDGRMSAEIKTIVPKHVSPTSVLAEVQSTLPDIDQIYVIYKSKDGTWFESVAGDLHGMSFAVLMLQNFVIKQFSLQEAE